MTMKILIKNCFFELNRNKKTNNNLLYYEISKYSMIIFILSLKGSITLLKLHLSKNKVFLYYNSTIDWINWYEEGASFHGFVIGLKTK